MKRGDSQVIATVFLIGITMTLGAIIFLWGNMFFVALSPPVNCERVNFEAGIFENNLDIMNNGNENLHGFVIKQIDEGSVEIIEKINLETPLKSGRAYTQGGEYTSKILVVPIVQLENEEETLASCPDNFGVEVSS